MRALGCGSATHIMNVEPEELLQPWCYICTYTEHHSPFSVHADLRCHQMAGGVGCSARCCRVWGEGWGVVVLFSTSEAEELTGPWTQRHCGGGALPPNGVSSPLLPRRASFIWAPGVGFEGLPVIRLQAPSAFPVPALSIIFSAVFLSSFLYNYYSCFRLSPLTVKQNRVK